MNTRAKRPVWVTVLLLIAAAVYAVMRGPNAAPTNSASVPETTPLPSRQPAPSTPRAPEATKPAPATPAAKAPSKDGGIPALFAAKTSDTWVEAEGRIKKVLDDDSDIEGGLHQRWIVRLAGGHEILIAHNHEVAGRVPVKEGDTIRFRGEYEYTEKGGTVHFTHAPKTKRREAGGWVEHDGRRYQ